MQARIVRLAVVVSMVAIAVFGLPLAVGAARYYVVAEQSDLEGDAQVAADAVAPVIAAGQEPVDVAPVAIDSPTAVYRLDGRRIAGDGPPVLDDGLTEALRGRTVRSSAGGEFRVAVPVFSGDDHVAVLRAARSRDDVLARTGVTWAAMLVLGAAAVGGTLLVSRRLAGRLSAPLEDLARDAARLGDGDFTPGHAPGTAVPEVAAVHASLSSTARRLEDLLARERAFSAEASHQLRTPLAGLRLRLEEAAGLSGDDPALGPALDGALDSADRLDRTVTELLRLARESAPAAAELAVDELATRVVAEIRADGVPPGRAVSVEVEPGGTLRGAASEAAVRQVLAVLVDNALVHGAGQVRVAVRDAGPAVAVDVTDEGRLDLGDRDLFAGRGTRPDGHGIGLALARRLAEAQGGRLRLRSASPTTMTLLLPGPAGGSED